MKVIFFSYLSSKSDKDLIAFRQHVSEKTFHKAIRESLRLAIRPGYTTQFFKDLKVDATWDADLNNIKHNINISISKTEDEDVREMLRAAKQRGCSNVIKMALRFALGARYVVGFYLKGDDYINSVVSKDNLFYIQKAPTKVVYKVVGNVETKGSIKDKPKENIPATIPVPAVKEEPKEESSFSLPGMSGGMGELVLGEDTKEKDPAFDDDDDILSMLDGMM